MYPGVSEDQFITKSDGVVFVKTFYLIPNSLLYLRFARISTGYGPTAYTRRWKVDVRGTQSVIKLELDSRETELNHLSRSRPIFTRSNVANHD